jgi:hypothetical protein
VGKLIVISFGSFEVLFYKARDILSEKCCVHRVGNDVVPDNLDSNREKLHTSRIPTSPSFFCVALGS